MANQSISARLAACGNRPSGFDYMRLVLASLVVWSHTVNITMGTPAVYKLWSNPFAYPFLVAILPMFFCLSGFLVAGSLERCKTMISFVGLRLVRLVPALAVDTVIAALILGPIFTTLSLGHYFTNLVFFRYFLNIVGEIHFYLPGVFESNPSTRVNGQLWTLPYELKCYAFLTVMALCGLVRWRNGFAALSLAYIFVIFFDSLGEPAAVRTTVPGPVLVECFLLGVSIYLFRSVVILNSALFLIAIAAIPIMLQHPHGVYFLGIPISYVTVYLGLLMPPRLKIVTSGDYSYGIFLYGYPIQQAVVALFGTDPWLNLFLSYPVILLIAIFSWFFVEKPALKFRPKIYAFEAKMTALAKNVPLGSWFVRSPAAPSLPRPPAGE